MNRAPYLLVAVALALFAFVAWSLATTIEPGEPTYLRPVLREEPVVTTQPPYEPVGRPRQAATTLAPRVRKAVFQSAYASEVVTLIREGFARFGPDVAEQAVRVAACETGGTFDPHATNGVHRGLFQVSTRYHAERVRRLGFTLEQLWQARPNIAVAADLYADSGWGPWQCQP